MKLTPPSTGLRSVLDPGPPASAAAAPGAVGHTLLGPGLDPSLGQGIGLGLGFGRARLFAAVALVAFANGLAGRVVRWSALDAGHAFLRLFDVSAVVWVALAVAIALLVKEAGRGADRAASLGDWIVAALALFFCLLPVAPLAWLALTLVSAWLTATSPSGGPAARAGVILLAVTVPMLWSRIAFAIFGDWLLRLDAAIVSTVLGTARDGNAVAFVDGWGYFWIAPECSSIANVSLAIVTWMLVTRGFFPEAVRRWRYPVAAVLAVMLFNDARIALTGLSRESHDIVHGPLGNAVAGVISMALIFAISLLGARQGMPSRTARARPVGKAGPHAAP